MSDKFTARQRRSRKLRSKTKEMSNHRLSIFRSNNQIYAQVFSPDGKEAAKKVGELVAKRAIEKGIKKVTFDRSGYKYHGRVKSLAESAREAGLEF